MEVSGRLHASDTVPLGREPGSPHSRSGLCGVRKLVITIIFADNIDDIWKAVTPSVFLAIYFFSVGYRAQDTPKYVPSVTQCEIMM